MKTETEKFNMILLRWLLIWCEDNKATVEIQYVYTFACACDRSRCVLRRFTSFHHKNANDGLLCLCVRELWTHSRQEHVHTKKPICLRYNCQTAQTIEAKTSTTLIGRFATYTDAANNDTNITFTTSLTSQNVADCGQNTQQLNLFFNLI